MLNCKNITEKQYFMKQNTINYTYFGNVYSEIDRSTSNHAANIAGPYIDIYIYMSMGPYTSQIPSDILFSYNNEVYSVQCLLSVGKLYDQGKCIKTGCRHFKPVSGWIKLFSRNGQGPLIYSVGTMPMPDF